MVRVADAVKIIDRETRIVEGGIHTMALFESMERRIDKINSVLNSYGIASIEEAEKELPRMPVLMFIKWLKAFSLSALRMLAGLTQ